MKHLVFTNSFNAAAIARGLALLGRTLESTVPPPGLVTSAGRPPHPGDTLFFTEERSLKQYAGDNRFSRWPRASVLIIDDKLQFATCLRARNERPVPFSASLDQPAMFPVALRAKHSWLNGQPLPRGFVCHSPQQLAAAFRKLDQRGLPRNAFFLQRYLLGTNNGYSTCGFFDSCEPRRCAILVTHRALATGTGLQSGAIVETIDDPGGLVARTEQILSAMQYAGPFELEFLRSQDGQFFVLELNPRFWMQHGLFIDFFENVLLRRYVDEHDATPFVGGGRAMQPIVWLNTWYFVQSLLRSDARTCDAYFAKLRQCARGRIRARWYPSMREAFTWLAHTPQRRFLRSLRRCMHEIDSTATLQSDRAA
ncbi:MAG: hypothetical protein WD468_08215 [Pirellulales bacterium]